MSHDVVVVGAGIAGLTVAHALTTARPEISLSVVEATDRAGGKVLTSTAAGYTFEHASTGIASHRPETAGLIAALGLQGRVLTASEAAARQFVYARGALCPVPRTLGAAVRTRLLSPRGKLRVLAEPVAGRRRAPDAESVYDFAARRFGHEVARVFVATALQGVTAGDARETSLRAAFPRLHQMEQAAGRAGLLGLAVRSRRREASPSSFATFAGGGLRALPDALAGGLAGRVRYGAGVRAIRSGNVRRFAVVLSTAETLEAETVVVAVPAYEAAAMLGDLAPAVAAELAEIPYAGVRVLGLGYRRSDLPRGFDGFGFMAARSAGLRILGVVASSNLFPEQAPPGRVLLRVFVGGVDEPELAECPVDVATNGAQAALERVLGISAEPECVLDASWPRAIPQYHRGHLARLAMVDTRLAAHPGLYIAGNAYRGVGLDDTIREATRLAERVLAHGQIGQEADAP